MGTEDEVKREGDIPRPPRRDRLIREHIHDRYKTRLKLPEPTVCPQCGAVFHEGRWRWGPRPDGAHEELCQACHRINDRYPAGELTIKGEFAARHRDEIVHLARHHEEQEKAEHPLHRIMERGGAIVCGRPTSTCRGGSARHYTMLITAISISTMRRRRTSSGSGGPAMADRCSEQAEGRRGTQEP
jgi:hypothetical protein